MLSNNWLQIRRLNDKVIYWIEYVRLRFGNRRCNVSHRSLSVRWFYVPSIDKLEPLNIEARYPSYKERLMKSLSKEYCQQLLKETKELQQWIKNKL